MSDYEYTGDDLDALNVLVFDRGFQLFLQRTQQLLVRRQAELEQDLDPETTAKCRGRISELKTVLGLREILLDEAKRSVKEDEDENDTSHKRPGPDGSKPRRR